MRDPQPALVLLVCQGVLLALVLGHWLVLPPAQRQLRLVDVLLLERAATPPPPTLVDQVGWLVDHRVQRLRMLGGLVGLAASLGLLEGWEQRRRDPYGGVGFFHFALGQMLLAGTVGAVMGFVLLPWPLPPLAVAALLAGLACLTLFCLAAGKPRIR